MSSHKLTFGSLFSGIGGFDLGFHWAGLECKWQVEIDPDCQRELKHNFPNVKIHDDVKAVGVKNLEPVDVICFGSPCQGLSAAGLRRGFADERSVLFFQATRIIKELKPTFAVWENVPGSLSSNGGRDFAVALAALRECGACDIAWRVIDASSFGVPTSRKRLFLVADYAGERSSEILFEQSHIEQNEIPSLIPVFDFKSMWYRVYDPLGVAVTFRALAGGGGAKNGLYTVDTPPDPDGKFISDGIPSRLVGNSIIPKVAEWLGRNLTKREPDVCNVTVGVGTGE